MHRHPALSRADALVTVAESFLTAAARGEDEALAARAAGGASIELVVHADAAVLRADTDGATDANDARATDATEAGTTPTAHAHDPTQCHATLADGTALALATVQRLACDAAVVTIAHDAAGNVTQASRRTRRISTTLRRALRTRDGGCRFPGCTNLLTDAHHVVAWARGGATTLRNLCSLCRRHHRLVHEHGYRITTAPDGELRFLRRDGTPLPRADERRTEPHDTQHPVRRLDGVAALRAAHEARGLAIDARTAAPRWDGEPVDYHLAVQALLADDRHRPHDATAPAPHPRP